jgi:hypothetical protein
VEQKLILHDVYSDNSPDKKSLIAYRTNSVPISPVAEEVPKHKLDKNI